ncbi:hypothetical protein STEG23_023540 [Scotinomys teguina]
MCKRSWLLPLPDPEPEKPRINCQTASEDSDFKSGGDHCFTGYSGNPVQKSTSCPQSSNHCAEEAAVSLHVKEKGETEKQEDLEIGAGAAGSREILIFLRHKILCLEKKVMMFQEGTVPRTRQSP